MDSITVDKAKLLQDAIAQIEEMLRRLASGYAVAKEAVLDSPHVMKSKREVTGIESSYLANALAGNIQEREFWLRTLKSLRLPKSPQRAALGCVVGLSKAGGPVERLYFILPVCGGMQIPLEGGSKVVRIVTPETPMAKAIIGKSLGDEVMIRKGQEQPEYVRVLL